MLGADNSSAYPKQVFRTRWFFFIYLIFPDVSDTIILKQIQQRSDVLACLDSLRRSDSAACRDFLQTHAASYQLVPRRWDHQLGGREGAAGNPNHRDRDPPHITGTRDELAGALRAPESKSVRAAVCAQHPGAPHPRRDSGPVRPLPQYRRQAGGSVLRVPLAGPSRRGRHPPAERR